MAFLVSFGTEMEHTLQEEHSLKLQVEGKLLQLEKDHSMLDCDYKQAQQKLNELTAQKDKLLEEVRLSLYAERAVCSGLCTLHLPNTWMYKCMTP